MVSTASWLPTTKEEVIKKGWEEIDIILFTGDAYIDHPAFGTAVIGRYLEKHNFKVAIVPQPNWRDDLRDFKKLGAPRLFFGVTAGNMDSMINHYTAAKRKRSDDAYSPGGQTGFRPDYPAIVYTRALKNLFPGIPVILGGIEASLRRLTHYDYWQDTLRPSVLKESGADMLIYGMGEKAVVEVARALNSGKAIHQLRHIPQTAFLASDITDIESEKLWLPSFSDCVRDMKAFAKAFKIIETESNKMKPKVLIEPQDDGFLVVNPTYDIAAEEEMDSFYDLPYTRMPHPRYYRRGAIPAYEMIKHSVTLHRGCFGGCAFCTISAHQGKFVSSRSESSVLNEIEAVTNQAGFKGYISDLGGPSANMYRMQGLNLALCEKCQRPSCIFPSRCNNLNTDHRPLIRIYDKSVLVKGIKKVFIGSGVRYDMFIDRPREEEKQNAYTEYFEKLVSRHVSGRLKVAPEHTSDRVLHLMRKPSFALFHSLKRKFDEINRRSGLNQQLIPYFISSHPGCRLEDMADLAEETRKLGYRLEQIQDLTPTPMTLASVMYYTGLDPYTLKPVYVARSKQEKEEQRRFFFWYKPENREWVSRMMKRLNK
jgi:uncharacterized radical SAM protein YgiQ